MEKYARAALAEGVKSADDIHITIESELYRLLNLHYNRNNHIDVRIRNHISLSLMRIFHTKKELDLISSSQVPSNFRYVVEQTLREFFKAIQNRKDAEQSWKKTIYKVCRNIFKT